jgi:hypothetical protein
VKNEIFVSDEEKAHIEETKDLTVSDLESLDAFVGLGYSAAEMLKSFGSATFLVDEEGKIRLANPLNVYIDTSLAHPPDGVEARFVRPLITDGKPQYVAKKPDGSLWQIEYSSPLLDESLDGELESFTSEE